jgi:hypothetical protein
MAPPHATRPARAVTGCGPQKTDRLGSAIAKTRPPPGRASLPGHPTGVFKLLTGKNFKHTWRWLQVRQLREMSPDMTWEDTFNAVAKAEAASKRSVAWQTVESSYKKVENAIKAGNEADFL